MGNKQYRISLIGSGNVAWHLAPAFENAGHAVQEVYSRHLSSAKKLTTTLYNCKPTDSTDFSESSAEIFFLLVPDDAMDQVIDQLVLPSRAYIAHTSGSRHIDILSTFGERSGVLYPVQTFTKGRKLSLEPVPFCIEAKSDHMEDILYSLVKSISKEIYYLTSEQRKSLHIAAVFANNFTNHIIAQSKQLLDEQNLNFDILHALILETARKAVSMDPKMAQTGPAKRNDTGLITDHLNALSYNVDLQTLYKVLTDSILKSYRT